MIKFRHFFIIFIVIIQSCADKRDTLNCVEWDCSEINSIDTLDYTRLFPNQCCVEFEETEKSRIGSIDKIIEDDSIMFVLDCNIGRKVFLFNRDSGRFLNCIGDIGKGHGEYVMLYDFALDKKEKKVYLLADKKRILEFDFEGKYIQESKLDFCAVKMTYLDKMFCFVCEEKDNYNLICTNRELKIINSYFDNNDLGEVYVRLCCPLQTIGDEYVTYIKYMDNNIYKIDKEGNMSVLYHVSMGDNEYDFDDAKGKLYKEIVDETKLRNCDISSFIENEDYAFITFFCNENPVVSIYDKHRGKSMTYMLDKVKNSYSNSLANPIWIYGSNCFMMDLTDDLYPNIDVNILEHNPRVIKMN